MNPFAGYLLTQRNTRQVSVSELAERAGVSASAISRLESGDLEPSKDLALRLAKALESTEDDWLLAAGFLPEELRTAIGLEPSIAIPTLREALPSILQSYSRLISLLRTVAVEFLPEVQVLSKKGDREITACRGKAGFAKTDEDLIVEVILLELARGLSPRHVGALIDAHLPNLRSKVAGKLDTEILDLASKICRNDERMLGPVFEGLLSRNSRYELGQYFTPPSISRFMRQIIEAKNPKSVFDPAVGAGVLLSGFGGSIRLMGMDINPVCTALALAGLASRGHTSLDVTVGDFLEDKQSLFGKSERTAEKVDAVICNPPYMRHHLIEGHEKKRLTTHYSTLFGVKVSSLATSYLYFFLESLSRLKPGGTLVFITPADFLDANYGNGLKQIFKERATIEDIILFDRDGLAFEGVLTTSAITVVTNSPAPSTHIISFREAKAMVNEEVETTRPNRRKQSGLDAAVSWTSCFGEREDELKQLVKDRPRKLSDYMRIRRGIATGDNSFFVIPQSVVDEWGIEAEYLQPVVASARDLPDGVLTREHWQKLKEAGRPCWLLNCSHPKSELTGKKILAYLEHGESLGIHERFNCRTRNPWYKGEQVAVPDIIITYMNRGRTRFVENRSDCRVMSVFINGFVIEPGIPMMSLLETLNSAETSEILTRIGKVYGSGLGKVEPGTLASLPMPALNDRAGEPTAQTSTGRRAGAPKPSRSLPPPHRPDSSDRSTHKEIG